MTNRITHLLVLAMAACAASCTVSNTPAPPLTGPSEMSLSLTISANPDVLSLDGSSQTLVTIDARDTNGQPAANVPLRLEIFADGQAVDYGTLSARTLVTGSNGRATFTYTAPVLVGGAIPALQLSVTPTGCVEPRPPACAPADASAHIRRLISIRLVPPGVIAIAPTARFTPSPGNPAAFTDVRFDGSASTAGLGASLVTYVWDFGDNTSATGVIATHRYGAPGTYYAVLTVTDSNGLSAQSAAQAVAVGAGVAPTADFLFSPTSPAANETIFFNGTSSTAGAGHQIVRYDWDFGSGSRRSGSTVSKSYDTPGTYNVVLTVTDEVGQTGQGTRSVTISSTGATPTAVFTVSPTDPVVGTTLFFNASASTAPSGSTIKFYAWDFGDGTTATDSTLSTFQKTGGYGTAFTYTIRLTVTDSAGRKGTSTQNLTVAP